jgi:hypothetical protein
VKQLRQLRLGFGILLLFALGAVPAIWGQAVSATLVGTVTDNTGAVVPKANVTILENATGIEHAGQSNESGNFTFPDLTPGAYTVTVAAQGFKKERRAGVDVEVNSTTRVDVSLVPGDVTQTITVTGAPPILETDRADVSTNIDVQTLSSLPIAVNQNFQTLLTLVPGVGTGSFQHSQFYNATSSIQNQINGQPLEGNSYQIEGIDDDQRTDMLQILIPPAQAIESVDVSTSNYEAELGRATGAVTNVIIKSGTNQFHGLLTEYVQNSDADARAYFNTSVGHVAYNYFGGALGGPIKKDKLFFYGDFFRSPDHEANNNVHTIPPTQWYTCILNPSYGQVIDLSGPLNTSTGKGQIFDPATGTSSGTGRTPFPNNQIPCNATAAANEGVISHADSVSLKLMNLMKPQNNNLSTATTTASNDFAITLPFQKTTDRYDIKVDDQITAKDHLSARYEAQNVNIFQAPTFGPAGGGPSQGNFEGTGIQNTQSYGLNYDRAFSSTLLTEARVGVGHYGNSALASDYGTNDATNIGIPGVNISPFTSGQVSIATADFSSFLIGYSASLPWVRAETNFDVVNHWTKIVRNHTFKFGADVRRVHDDLLQDQTYGARGQVSFSENNTGENGGPSTDIANTMASILLDAPSGAGRDLNTYFPRYRQWWIFSFVGDKWQVSPKLTLDLGMRWELYPPATPGTAQGFSNYNQVNNTLVVVGVGGNPNNLGLPNDYHYFAPRVGFADRVREKTVVRGGFGISYAPFFDNTYAYNYPVRANNAYSQLNSYQPALLSNGSPYTFEGGFPAPVPVPIPANGIIAANTAQLISQAYTVIPQTYRNPYVESWNVAVQQDLPGQFNAQLSYVANHGTRNSVYQNVNLPSALNQGAAGDAEYNCVGCPVGMNRTATTNVYFYGFSSNYYSLQAELNRRFTGNLGVTTSFTWGKGFGYMNGDAGTLAFWLDQRHNYALTPWNQKFNFEEAFTYVLPVGPGQRWLNTGRAASILGGWKIAGQISAYSGTPFTVTANGGNINTGGETQPANITGAYRVLHGIGAGHNWFDPTVFSQPAGCAPPVGTPCPLVYGTSIGNVGFDKFTGPGAIQDNASLFKTFALHENWQLDARVDAFQLSNTPQFSNPSSGITSSTFGQVTGTVGSGTGINGTGGGRTLQLSGTVHF